MLGHVFTCPVMKMVDICHDQQKDISGSLQPVSFHSFSHNVYTYQHAMKSEEQDTRVV